jgi:hypothetical protein
MKGWIEPRPKLCPCGSGLIRREMHDIRGYFVTFYCEACEKQKVAGLNPAIFTDYNYPEIGEDDDD